MIKILPTDTCYGISADFYSEKDYLKIFELKGRDFKKQLSIVVRDFDELKSLTILNFAQITFLKNYKKPFTVITSLKSDFVLPEFLDKNLYKTFGIRIGELIFDKEINKSIKYPIFLTSANITNNPEIYEFKDIIKTFGTKNISISCKNLINNSPSDIFEFIGKTTDIDYIRKNH